MSTPFHTHSGKAYRTHPKHRNGTPGASQWATSISESIEFSIFEAAEREGWVDGAGNYWGVGVSRNSRPQILGTLSEAYSKHPATSNPSDPWHGYPASPAKKGSGDVPPKDILDTWLARSIISRALKKRIMQWKV